jgi:DNA adenine methylase
MYQSLITLDLNYYRPMNELSPCKPFLRWAGSKKQLLPYLQDVINIDYNCYFEPFMGSSQLYFKLHPAKAIISDINKDLVDTYIVIKDYPGELFDKLDLLSSDKELYYKLRSISPATIDPIERAVRFIYLNMNCFNGLYRTNLSGEFNVPYSGNKIKRKMKIEEIMSCSDQLRNTQILNLDFEQVIRENLTRNDLCYLDPPYAVNNNKIFQQYSPNSFGLDDLKRLDNLLDFINEKEAYFILSYAFCDEIDFISKKWNNSKVFTKRNISGFVKSRRIEPELIITNLN